MKYPRTHISSKNFVHNIFIKQCNYHKSKFWHPFLSTMLTGRAPRKMARRVRPNTGATAGTGAVAAITEIGFLRFILRIIGRMVGRRTRTTDWVPARRPPYLHSNPATEEPRGSTSRGKVSTTTTTNTRAGNTRAVRTGVTISRLNLKCHANTLEWRVGESFFYMASENAISLQCYLKDTFYYCLFCTHSGSNPNIGNHCSVYRVSYFLTKHL